MANLNSVQEAQLAPQGGSNANLNVAWGTYEFTANPADADTVTMFEMPAGASVFTGWLIGDDLDTGIEALDIDVGDADDTDRFGNFGVITGDAVTGTKPEAGILLQLFGTLKDGPYTYTANTKVLVTVNTNSATGGTGTLSLYLLYSYNDARVSPSAKPL